MPVERELSELFRGVTVGSWFNHRLHPQKRDGLEEVAGGMGTGGGSRRVG